MFIVFIRIFIICSLLIPAIAFPNNIPDTGQTKCYDYEKEIPCPQPGEDFYGQDASYNISPPSYTKLDSNGDDLQDSATSWAMVRDNVTGLIWENKEDKDGEKDYANPHDADNTYTQADGANTDFFISSLNNSTFGGYYDWRMPTVNELHFIIDRSIINPSINGDYFPNTLPSWYWSSMDNDTNTWIVNFQNGMDTYQNKTNLNYVRAVRGGQPIPYCHWIINNDGTVTDTATGLMWQQATPVQTMNWEGALNYCETLSLAGHDDWRLPSLHELKSIVDYQRFNPTIDKVLFPDTILSHYRSSTTDVNNPGYSWCIEFDNGQVSGTEKSSSINGNVRAVRGGVLVANAGVEQTVLNEVTLDGSYSVDLNGTIVSYHWELNHRENESYNKTADGVSPTVSNLEEGFYDVTLIVIDDNGATDTDEMVCSATGGILGDVNNDGKLSMEDCIYVLQVLTGIR